MSDSNRDTYRGFPFKGIAVFYGHGKVGERRRSHAYGVRHPPLPPYPSPYPAYPFVRPAVPSRHRSYIDARFRGECQSVDNLFERRASNVSYLRNRARASAVRCGILDFAPFSCPTIVCPTLRDGVDLFRRYRRRGRPRCLLTNRSCNSDRTRIFIAEEKSRRDHAPRRQGSQFRCAFRETRLKCQ